MKKLLISLLVGSILISVGTGVLLLEFSEYSFQDYPQKILNSSQKVHTLTYDEKEYTLTENPVVISLPSIAYRNSYGNSEVVLDKTVTDGFLVDVYYKGELPNLGYYTQHRERNYDYDDDYDRDEIKRVQDEKLYVSIHAYQNSINPKYIFDFVEDIFQNKMFIGYVENFLIEKIVVRTNHPERITFDR